MKPETTNHQPLTAGQLARMLKRSRWGVKLTLDRMEIEPQQVLNGISYYPSTTLDLLKKEMRKANVA